VVRNVLRGGGSHGSGTGTEPRPPLEDGPGWSERVPELALGGGIVAAFAVTAILVTTHPTAEAASFSTAEQHSVVQPSTTPSSVAPSSVTPSSAASFSAAPPPAGTGPLPRVLMLPVGEATAVLHEAGAEVRTHTADDGGPAGDDWFVCQAAEVPGDVVREVSLIAAPGPADCP
jgi:hypothetical protein